MAFTFILFLFSKYPDVQERVYKEILRVTGGRRPSLTDRLNLDYTMAVLNEVMR